MTDHARPKTAKRGGIREIDIAPVTKDFLLVIGQEAHCEGIGFSSHQDRGLHPDRFQTSESPPHGLGINPQMNIGGIRCLSDLQVLIDVRQRLEFAVDGDICVSH